MLLFGWHPKLLFGRGQAATRFLLESRIYKDLSEHLSC
jgi:hypothetical protein